MHKHLICLLIIISLDLLNNYWQVYMTVLIFSDVCRILSHVSIFQKVFIQRSLWIVVDGNNKIVIMLIFTYYAIEACNDALYIHQFHVNVFFWSCWFSI